MYIYSKNSINLSPPSLRVRKVNFLQIHFYSRYKLIRLHKFPTAAMKISRVFAISWKTFHTQADRGANNSLPVQSDLHNFESFHNIVTNQTYATCATLTGDCSTVLSEECLRKLCEKTHFFFFGIHFTFSLIRWVTIFLTCGAIRNK